MNRYVAWKNKPITWGGFLTITGICTAIGTVISAVYCVILMEPAWWKATKDFMRRLFKK